MVIEINITDKRPTVIGAPSIVCGNSGYSIQFVFDSEWDAGSNKTARFVYVQKGALKFQDVDFTGNTVDVPVLAGIREVMVGVYAGDLRTTTPARIPCEYSILCPDAQEQIGAVNAAKLQDQIGDLSQLKTTDSSDLVAAINWLYENGTIGGGGTVSASGIFVPHVSADGTLSWTNDQGLPNPEPVNLRGPQGPKGADGTMSFEDLTTEQRESLRGPAGPQGEKGEAGVWVGSEAPTDNSYKVWVDPTGEAGPGSGGNVDLTGYAKTEDIPTKVSQMKNDSGFIDTAIIDVIELPTEDIREDVFYRVLSGSFVFNQQVYTMFTVHCVKNLPETGLPAMNAEATEGNVYYTVEDGEVYGYVDDVLSAGMGVPVGWYPAATLIGALGFEYAGVITNILDDPDDGKFRLLLEYVVYDYKNGSWTSHKKIGWAGTGASAEIFNHRSNIASGVVAHAEGGNTIADGDYSHAEGLSTHAKGRASHAEGSETYAEGDYSHAEGAFVTAEGDYSHAEGFYTRAMGAYQHVQGRYNIQDTQNKYAHIVGNGEGSRHSNAHTLDWDGNAWFQGNIYYGGNGQDDPNARQLNFNYAAYGLPIVYLNGSTSAMNKDTKVTLDYVYGERSGTAQVKWQGTSSLAYPKKNYSIEFDTAFEAKDGWGEHKDYVLKANWVDFSHARNVVSAMLWYKFNNANSDSPFKGLPNGGAIDGFPCMVVINGVYQGLYTFTIPKKPWLFGMDETNLNACIIGGGHDTSSTRFKAETIIDDGTNFEFEYLPDGADVEALTNSFKQIYTKINAVSGWGTTFNEETGLASVLDIESAFYYYIHCVLTCNSDGRSKNVLYATVDGKKWYMSPYDLDATFGNKPSGTGYYVNQDHTFKTYSGFSKLFEALYNHGNAAYLKNYYDSARKYYMREIDIMDKFYNYMVQIPKAVLDEEARLWPGIPGTNTNNLFQIIEFYKQRVVILDAEITALVATSES